MNDKDKINTTKNKINNEKPKTKMGNINSKKDKSKDFEKKYKYLLAETENLRKQFEKEKENVYKYKLSNFILELLPSLEMFEQVLNSDNVSEEIKNWLIGFNMIHQNIVKILENEGVTKINLKVGDIFDSEKHHALEKVEDKNLKNNQIKTIKTNGYMIKDRLLKPAIVIVVNNNLKSKNKEKNIKSNKEK